MNDKFKIIPTKVVVHPLVLLSTVDHYNRVAKDTNRRVVGVLLGETRRTKNNEIIVDATNSFAVPFEEEDGKSNIWYLDHNFLENMAGMFRKVNARENVIGWYSSGPRIRKDDLEIHQLFRKYSTNPVFVIIDVQPKEEFEIPTKGYVAIEEVREDATEAPTLQFKHITSEIGALEAEEVGVEHLLRDVKDTSISTLASQLNSQMLSLKSFISHLDEMTEYLDKVCNGKLPMNQQILGQLQDIFNTSPNLSVEELAKAFSIKTNDMMLVIFLSSMIRSIIALHSLINNKLELKEIEKEDYEEKKETNDKEEKETGQEKEKPEIKANDKK